MPTNKKKYLFVYICSNNPKTDSHSEITNEDVIKTVEEIKKIRSKKEDTSIDLFLNSPGGDIYSAYKIINILREKCSRLRIIIPEFANSAATLMSLGGDIIIMGPQSELGPLDKPMEHPLLEGTGRMSALDGALPFLDLFDATKEFAFELANEFRDSYGLSRKDSLELGFRIAHNYVSSTVKKMDSFILNKCKRWLRVPQKYGIEFLENYMFQEDIRTAKNGELELVKQRINRLIHNLVWAYPEHSFAISFLEAKKIGLKVEPSSELKEWDLLWEFYKTLEKRREKTVGFYSIKDLQDITKKNNKDL